VILDGRRFQSALFQVFGLDPLWMGPCSL
jgi:hypothetical protein